MRPPLPMRQPPLGRGTAPASTSAHTAPSTPLSHIWGSAPAPRRGPPPPRITNTGEELDPDGSMTAARLGTAAPIHLQPEHESLTPGGAPLERSVDMLYLEALFTDEVRADDGTYWFSTPEGGWMSEEVVRERAKAVEVPPPSGLRDTDAPDFSSRTPLKGMRVGDVVKAAVIQGGAKAAGILVDVGCAWDGLLPVANPLLPRQWKQVIKPHFPLGGTVDVRIARIDFSPLARFPLVLELAGEVEDEVAACFLPAASYRGAFDLRNAGDDPLTLNALTGGAWSGGRPYETLSIPAGAHGIGHAVREEREALAAEVRGSYAPGTPDLGLAEDAAGVEAAREAAAEAAGRPGPPTGVFEIDWSEAGPPGPSDAVGEVGWMSHDGAAYWL